MGVCYRQWRIQNFPEGATNPEFGAKTFFKIFAENRIPNVKIVKNPSLVVVPCTFTMY